MPRIVRIHDYGGPEVLRLEELEVSEPAADEVQIAVKAIGINRAEVMFRNHAYLQEATFPSRLGYEAAGVVQRVGADVEGFSQGDAVSLVPPLDIAKWGTYGEVANVPARLLVKHPDTLSFEQAAAVWMPYVTAYGALIDQAGLTRDDFVIVTAASSSVGIAAFQVAKQVGASVIATTRTSAKRDALRAAGADHVIATEEEDLPERVMEITQGQGARVVFDPVGGPALEPLTAAMATGGILLVYGALSPEASPFPLFTVLGKTLTLKGYLYSEIVSDDARLDGAKRFILEGLEAGVLKPTITRTFPLEQIQEAHRFLESNQQVGKVVVTV
ncbi:zinc-dependent alcohol dehydrogenase family protein [Halomonas sp. McH1-25]|uniref:zinc-dependent alcohol dehydrogenase family protein n=1 Tax=unclassified Halomonas TaxID=2609666 RepID=UPI001EF3FB86|nr:MULTISPECIES: zinc-dependent alcohol dehydrogenase family protein [unclassified Halomonas]MCG7600093.1 zinc-dependent alcohol dehydrogenase family protein [Halomonas sp. McH1-25]MCP1341342.1 zinc-dependent alcohol dehydrogenase family protein [Halomonas sp. FL8]MCP1359713.1 zinc-dependent alcohol dehydrogenase family protein [Halomonas sp. BBD45]MCP1365764.1 zinc-dependent alcohol dehydrogenase family protein [Halomonas sp. BBD48]